MKKITYLLVLALVFIACTNNDSLPDTQEEGVVYTAGFILKDKVTAVYWKNNDLVELTDGTVISRAEDIFVEGNDVHVVGYIQESDGIKKAAHWKNGVITKLATNNSEARGVYVLNNDVHIVGYEWVGGLAMIRYWKNGVEVDLSGKNINVPGLANSIFVENNDVYIAGSKTGINIRPVAGYWKNGTHVALEPNNGKVNSVIQSIFVSNNTVHTIGFKQTPSLGVQSETIYWKNASSEVFRSNYRYDVVSLQVVGNDLYVAAGKIWGVNSTEKPKYKKNNTEIVLSSEIGGTSAIKVLGSDVYVGGHIKDADNNTKPRYWKNGNVVTLPYGDKSGNVTAMYVRK